MEMRSGGGGGLLGGMPRDSIEYGAASSVMKARAMGAASGALNQMGGSGGIRGGLSSRLGGLSMNKNVEGSSEQSGSAFGGFGDIQPMRRQQHF
ncbi:uncharacterized protein LOC142337895 isoform X2 [Convolutriloba macropyga]|uniref:uncharacterized protein LOC142337895 isoform X2 n=1 Tax=Convolutriloba macropyga TaxID=536237 RepID=UPI003F51D96A